MPPHSQSVFAAEAAVLASVSVPCSMLAAANHAALPPLAAPTSESHVQSLFSTQRYFSLSFTYVTSPRYHNDKLSVLYTLLNTDY